MPSTSRASVRPLHALLLVAALVVAVLPAIVAAPAAEADSQVPRVSRENPISNAAAVALYGWDQAPIVFLATASGYADALAGTPAASMDDAPVLLTPQDRLADATRNALAELGTDRVVLLGGEAAISEDVAADLRNEGYETSRVAGEDRYQTAAHLAYITAGGDRDASIVALALGQAPDPSDAWPDALSAATFAGLDQPVPTVLSAPDHLPSPTHHTLSELSPDRVLVLGGPAAVRDSVIDEIESMGIDADRVYGRSRYGTSVEAAELGQRGTKRAGDLNSSHAVFVSGNAFSDALAAGALAAHRSAPLLLVRPDTIPDVVDGFVRDAPREIESGVLVGSPDAVSEHAHKEIDAAVRNIEPPRQCDPEYSSPDCAYIYEHKVSTWERLAECESNGNWHLNTGNGYYGGLQFSKGSWDSVGGTGYPHQHSKWEQIYRGEILEDSSKGWGHWPHCSSKLGYR